MKNCRSWMTLASISALLLGVVALAPARADHDDDIYNGRQQGYHQNDRYHNNNDNGYARVNNGGHRYRDHRNQEEHRYQDDLRRDQHRYNDHRLREGYGSGSHEAREAHRYQDHRDQENHRYQDDRRRDQHRYDDNRY